MNVEEKFELNNKESKDINNNKLEEKSMMSIENNLITRKKVKIKTLRRLNLDLPDDLVQYDNESQLASNKPQSKNQMIESYGELTHRSMFYQKLKKEENGEKNSSKHIENMKNKQLINFEIVENKENEKDNTIRNDNFILFYFFFLFF